MAEKVSAASERARGSGHVGSSCSGSSSGSETLSEEGEGGAAATAPGGATASPERAIPGGRAEDDASLEERDEELDHILSPPPMPFRKSSSPEVSSGLGKSPKFKRQLSEDGRQLRRGSLGGALTGKYLLPNATGQQLWQPIETTNLVRMRYQTFGQSAPSLTASLRMEADSLEQYISFLKLKYSRDSDDSCKSQNKETQTELNDPADLQALELGGET